MIIRTSRLQEGTTLTEDKDGIRLEKTVLLDPVLEANYEARKDSQNGFSKDKSYRRIMSVPMEVMMAWKQEFPEIMSGDREAENAALKILINREENQVFSTVENIRGIF